MHIELHAKTDIGRVRRANEDNLLVLDLASRAAWMIDETCVELPPALSRAEAHGQGLILVVSDGMGGALAGDVASRMTVETLRERLTEAAENGLAKSEKRRAKAAKNPTPINDEQTTARSLQLAAALLGATVEANAAIHRKGISDARFNGMGATLTGASITNTNRIALVQVGDSRAYLIRGDQIKLVTKDQSLVQQLIDVGQISEEQAETHVYRNVITQALGAQREVIPVTSFVEVERDDVLLLCSDGLSGKLRAVDLHRIISRTSNLAAACDALIDEANARGGEDNITVLLARFTGDDLRGGDTQSEIKVETIVGENVFDAFPFGDERTLEGAN